MIEAPCPPFMVNELGNGIEQAIGSALGGRQIRTPARAVEQSVDFRHGPFIGRSALRQRALLERPDQKLLDLRLLHPRLAGPGLDGLAGRQRVAQAMPRGLVGIGHLVYEVSHVCSL